MRLRNLVGAAAMISGTLTACSKPASQSGQAAREIALPAPPASEAPILSPLEAGQAIPLPPVRRSGSRGSAVSSAMAHRMASGGQAELAVPRVLPAASSGTLSVAAAPEQIPTAHAPVALPEADAQSGMSDNGYRGLGDYRGVVPARHDPVIIIRGGLGGIDDKCDLRPRGGISINRMAPPMGGRGIR